MQGPSMCIVDSDKDGKISSKEDDVGESLELVLGNDLELSFLTNICLMPQGSVLNEWCLYWQCPHPMGMLGNAVSCLHPRLLALRARSLSSVNPLNKCDAQSNLRFISLGRVQCGYPNVLRTFSMTGSFVHILHFILFSKGRLKRNIMPKKLEKKRQELFTKAKQRCHDRSVLPLRLTGCTFQKPVAKITFHPGDVVRCH